MVLDKSDDRGDEVMSSGWDEDIPISRRTHRVELMRAVRWAM